MEKKNRGYIITIVLLLLIIGLLGAHIINHKISDNREECVNLNNTTNK